MRIPILHLGSSRPSLAACALFLLLAARPAGALLLEIGLEFDGVTSLNTLGVPPDVMGAVGPDHVVQFTNRSFRVYDKETGLLGLPLSSARFWAEALGTAPEDDFDPRVVYDAGVGRFYAVAADERESPDSAFLFAVSSSSDPTDPWTGFRIDGDSTDQRWVDFPTLGYDADGVFLSADMFGNDPQTIEDRTAVVVIPKVDLLGDIPTLDRASVFENLPLDDLSYTPQQVVDLDGGGLPAPVIVSRSPAAVGISTIEGAVTSPTLGRLGDAGQVAVPPFPFALGAEQPGPARPLEILPNRFPSNAVIRNGVLWAARNVEIDGRAAIQWLRFAADSHILLESGEITDESLDLFYPSLSVNELDQVVIGFNGSGESLFASSFAVLGETVEGATRFGEIVLLKQGQASYERLRSGRNRWGDYGTTVVDPEDPAVFWTFQEWALGSSQWSTRITMLRVVPEPGTALLLACGLTLLGSRRSRPRQSRVTP